MCRKRSEVGSERLRIIGKGKTPSRAKDQDEIRRAKLHPLSGEINHLRDTSGEKMKNKTKLANLAPSKVSNEFHFRERPMKEGRKRG